MRGSPPQHTTYHVHGEPAASEVLRDRIDHELGWTGRRTPLRGRPGLQMGTIRPPGATRTALPYCARRT
ncbi:hypothetical protein [Streptomyces sp. NPDC127114]|uniref:hypothetical protein n=1 Tax=Streptomyces sp. NPDC127114 TaxID=3345366 RepID=UPI003625A5EA